MERSPTTIPFPEADGRRALDLAFYVKGFPPRETGGPVEVAHHVLRELLGDPANRVSLIVQTDSSLEDIRSLLEPRGTLEIVKLPYYPSLEDVRILRRMNRILRRATVVHFNEFPFRHLLYLFLAKLSGVPLVFSLHGRLSSEAASFLGAAYPVRVLGGRGVFELRVPRLAVSVLVGVYRKTNRVWSAVVVNSDATLRSATQTDGLDPSRAHIIPNGVDLPAAAPDPPRPHDGMPRLLFVGKLEDVKGPDLLFDALERLTDSGHAVDLTLAGRGALEPVLRSRASNIRNHRIHLLGEVPHDEALRRIAEADAVIVPSRYESFPLVILEAMAAARPIVATTVGGIPEILHPRENGFLAEPQPDALARAIGDFLDHPELWGPMGSRNAAAVRRYAWSAVASLYVALYRSLKASG